MAQYSLERAQSDVLVLVVDRLKQLFLKVQLYQTGLAVAHELGEDLGQPDPASFRFGMRQHALEDVHHGYLDLLAALMEDYRYNAAGCNLADDGLVGLAQLQHDLLQLIQVAPL